ncbi:MAG: transposase, partial [Acidobacteria bacterium]|nr:transposase [Acidobacteriota bacterium]
ESFSASSTRGAQKLCLCISDAHMGIQNALKKEWIGSSWQRCKVHFVFCQAKFPKKIVRNSP